MRAHVPLCCPEFNGLREVMWEGKRGTDPTRLLGDLEMANSSSELSTALATGRIVSNKEEPSSEGDALERHTNYWRCKGGRQFWNLDT